MKSDFYCKEGKEIAEYTIDKLAIISSNKKFNIQYLRLENDIDYCENINELKKRREIKQLDKSTGLNEVKLDKIRVIYFLYDDNVFVFLGTFIKKSKQTPDTILTTNNNRLRDYKKQKQRKVSQENGEQKHIS